MECLDFPECHLFLEVPEEEMQVYGQHIDTTGSA
jgi:hypothetical protein